LVGLYLTNVPVINVGGIVFDGFDLLNQVTILVMSINRLIELHDFP